MVPPGDGVMRIAGRGRRALLPGVDEALFAHPGQDDAAAGPRAREVRPRRKRRRGLGQAGEQRRLGQGQVLRVLAEQPPGHGLRPVGARAEVDAVQVHLEDLVLGELLLDHQGQHGFLRLAHVRAVVGEEERPGELLGEGAAPLDGAARQVPLRGAGDAQRVDPGMAVEAMVLDRDHRRAQVGRDLVQGDVAAVLVQREPRLAVGAVEDGVADPAGQAAHGEGVARGPEDGHRRPPAPRPPAATGGRSGRPGSRAAARDAGRRPASASRRPPPARLDQAARSGLRQGIRVQRISNVSLSRRQGAA